MPWLSAKRAGLLVFAAVLLLSASGAGSASPWRIAASRLPGFELSYPSGWHATLRQDGGIAISTWRLPRPDDFPARPPRSAYLVVFDYGRMLRPQPKRPPTFRLPPVSGYGVFGSGSMLHFNQAGHNFQVFVAFGRGASPETRALALRILTTLRTVAPPLANDQEIVVLGRSVQGRPIRAFHYGDFGSRRTILVVGCIHGTECAGMQATLQLINNPATRANLWVIQNLNPDGLHAGTRQNVDGVDLNRNFPSGWHPIGRRGDPQYSGPHPLSEPETRIVSKLIERVHPRITIWFHQPVDLVRAWGQSIPAARRYAHLVGLTFRRLPWLAGTAPNWQNHRFPASSSFVVELPPGPLSLVAARRHASAVLELASG